MRRSFQVAAPLLAAAAVALLTGCRKPEMQRCVDEHNNVVADSFCANQPNQPNQQQRSDGHGGFFFVPMPYRYYYGGNGGFGLGSPAGGGSFAPTPGRSYSTSRGGFGRSFSPGGSHSSEGGHSGGEGGHGGGAGE